LPYHSPRFTAPRQSRITEAEFGKLLDSNFRQTLGRLINRLRKTTSVSQDFEAALAEALVKRNWLVHHYFWDRAGQFMTSEGRNSMIRELKDIAHFFDSIDRELTVIDRAWATAHGITEEMRQSALENLIRSAEPN
jgi:hypothetical protein